MRRRSWSAPSALRFGGSSAGGPGFYTDFGFGMVQPGPGSSSSCRRGGYGSAGAGLISTAPADPPRSPPRPRAPSRPVVRPHRVDAPAWPWGPKGPKPMTPHSHHQRARRRQPQRIVEANLARRLRQRWGALCTSREDFSHGARARRGSRREAATWDPRWATHLMRSDP
jgi:hypothetical protein